ncbi:hypothetical protein IGI04_036719 [Brassica rapa subsp. trilocularis]|uniref:Uncharacterized protein n=1 Tax=Brassica rapa subsp. trilocularis TaxID=1813537 RepID=A0ABQ7LFA8_BRACM|nr:hypothetical protein IGI04_036719 [Brassica rapa subsp. trilocularis]
MLHQTKHKHGGRFGRGLSKISASMHDDPIKSLSNASVKDFAVSEYVHRGFKKGVMCKRAEISVASLPITQIQWNCIFFYFQEYPMRNVDANPYAIGQVIQESHHEFFETLVKIRGRNNQKLLRFRCEEHLSRANQPKKEFLKKKRGLKGSLQFQYF